VGLLDGKAAVVTGIGPGIGRATALALAEQGADIALGARTEATLKEVANEIEALGRRAVWHPTNIADNEQCLGLAKTAVDAFGKIDVVVQNAFMHGPFGGAVDSDPEDWRKVYKVNVMGTLQLVQACLPHMGEGGSVIVTNSMASRTSTPLESAYAASKAAMLSLVRTFAQEVGPRGIRVNSVLPGWVNGQSLDFYFEWLANERGVTPKDIHDEIANETAMKKLVVPDDIAGAIVFLASPLSNGITGITLDVNAGHFMPL
jgi:NAD(P)-dependent dehydrogenase (short-subunit alcohol dehydrogenase family)